MVHLPPPPKISEGKPCLGGTRRVPWRYPESTLDVPKNILEVPKGYRGGTLAVLGAAAEVSGKHLRCA